MHAFNVVTFTISKGNQLHSCFWDERATSKAALKLILKSTWPACSITDIVFFQCANITHNFHTAWAESFCTDLFCHAMKVLWLHEWNVHRTAESKSPPARHIYVKMKLETRNSKRPWRILAENESACICAHVPCARQRYNCFYGVICRNVDEKNTIY